MSKEENGAELKQSRVERREKVRNIEILARTWYWVGFEAGTT